MTSTIARIICKVRGHRNAHDILWTEPVGPHRMQSRVWLFGCQRCGHKDWVHE